MNFQTIAGEGFLGSGISLGFTANMARSLPELAIITSPSSVTNGLTTNSLGLLPNENPLEASPEKFHNSEPVFTSMACTAVLLARYATSPETDNPNQVVEPVHPLSNTATSRITVTSKIFFLIEKIVLL